MGAAAQQRREADEVGVLAVLGTKLGEWWRFREVCEALPALGTERVRSALVRLTMRGEVEQSQLADGAGNYRDPSKRGSFIWRVTAPRKEG